MTDINATEPAATPEENTAVSAPAVTYPYTENAVTHLGPDVTFDEETKTVTYAGTEYKLAKPVADKPLKDYKSGDLVDVIRAGDWCKGTVNGVEKLLKLIYVHTELGPVTVMRADGVRPRE